VPRLCADSQHHHARGPRLQGLGGCWGWEGMGESRDVEWKGKGRRRARQATPSMITHHFFFITYSQAPKKVTKKPAKKAAPKANPLFVAEPRSFRVGGAIRVSNACDDCDDEEERKGGLYGGWMCTGEGCLYFGWVEMFVSRPRRMFVCMPGF